MKEVDPDFSKSLFEDFAFRLFSTAQRLRHSVATLDQIAPYVGPEARAALLARAPVGQPVLAVVVGAMRTHAVSIPEGDDANVLVGIEYEANVTVAAATYFSVERWTFARSKAARTKPPNPARGFPCPNCGAPWSATDSGTQVCASCGQVVDNGRFDWVVTQISVRSIDQRPPTLTEEVEERGTDLPTYSDADVDERWEELEQADPGVDGDTFHARLTLIYTEMNKAWSANDLAPARGLVTDGLFDYLSYWTTAYQQQRLRNVLDDMRIEKTKLAKVDKDRWFDAVTVRIWATGKDYVVRVPEGSLVRGSKRAERAYSEYWTLIRSVARKGTPTAEPVCSNCGAPLSVTQSGVCTYCNAHVTLGEFDWVLSKIEQDDSYRG